MRLETERLVLREVTDKDVSNLTKSLNNLNISKWIVPMPFPYTKKDAKWWIGEQKKKIKEKPRRDYHFIIKLKSEKKLIGAVGVFGFDENKVMGELGYWLDENYWRKRYMSESVKEVIDYSFDRLKLKKLIIPVFADNLSSNALAKKLGFKLEGRFRKHVHCKATGKIHDEKVWGLLKDEWKKHRKKLK